MTWKSLAARILALGEVLSNDECRLKSLLREEDFLETLEAARGIIDSTGMLSADEFRRQTDNWNQILQKLPASIRFTALGYPNYPESLLQCLDAPPYLFFKGNIKPAFHVAIVGSRKASSETCQAAFELASRLVSNDIVVVSGLARGVDTAAHEGVLHAKGRTLAVLGTGINKIYPPENLKLARDISVQGAVLSQFPPDSQYRGSAFLLRNRVIAGLSSISIIMAAAENSGSRNEAEAAVSCGKRVLMWEPELGDQKWARELVELGKANFFSAQKEVLS